MTSSERLQAEVKAYAETIEDIACGNSEFGDIAEYFSDALDVEIICDLRGDYHGAIIALALGGPNIYLYLGTYTGEIRGYWGSDYSVWRVKSFAYDKCNEYFAELWDINRGC